MRDYFSCLGMPGQVRAPDSRCVQFGAEGCSDDFAPCHNGTLGHFLVWNQPHSYQHNYVAYPQPCRDYSNFGGEMDRSAHAGELNFTNTAGEGASFGHAHGGGGGGGGHHGGGGGYGGYGPGYGSGGVLLAEVIPDYSGDSGWMGEVQRMSVGRRG